MFRNFNNYEIYEDGRIWSYKTKRFLKPWTNKKGYKQVLLTDNEGVKKMYRVNRVVYEAVSGEPIPEGLQVNHLNEDKTDNRFENLNLMTPKENINFGTGISRSSKARTNGKLSKAVGAYRNGELLLTFPSTAEAHRQGFDFSAVAKCCNGKLQHYKGYEWRYI